MSMAEKLDVIDFIIKTLIEHEKKLDLLIKKLDFLINRKAKILEDWR